MAGPQLAPSLLALRDQVLSTVDCRLIFVYGSLRRGFQAQRLMRRLGARPVGMGSVRGRLFDLGEFPGAVKARGASARVVGELYRLSQPAPALKFLDRYEGSDYSREITEVELESGARATAWVYWLKTPPASKRQIRSGDYAKKG